jgi:peroxidase
MATKSRVLLLLPVALLLLAAGSSPAVAQLEIGYYSKTCPNVEAIVREEMEKIIAAAPSLAGPLLRLHFHDCFVRVSYITQLFTIASQTLYIHRVPMYMNIA